MTITDGNNCSEVKTYNVLEESSIEVHMDTEDESCNPK